MFLQIKQSLFEYFIHLFLIDFFLFASATMPHLSVFNRILRLLSKRNPHLDHNHSVSTHHKCDDSVGPIVGPSSVVNLSSIRFFRILISNLVVPSSKPNFSFLLVQIEEKTGFENFLNQFVLVSALGRDTGSDGFISTRP